MRSAMIVAHGSHFGWAWAAAARTAVDVAVVEVVPRLSWAPVADGVAIDPADAKHYQVERLRLRPSRLLGDVSSLLTARRVAACLQLVRIDHGPVDVLHSHFYPNASIMRFIKDRPPYVHTEHSSYLTLVSAPHKRLSRRGLRVANRVFRDAAFVLPVSDYLAACIRRLGLPVRLRVIGNPVDTGLFAPTTPEPDRIVAVGRLEADKQIDLLLQAFARVIRCRPDIRLEIIGDGPDRQMLQSLRDELGLTGAVAFSGWLKRAEVARRVSTARLFVHSARVETFGLAAAEALSAGTPVVAPATGALNELVEPGCGVLVTPGSANSLADGIRLALDTAFEPTALRRAITSRYSPPVIGAQVATVYEQVLAR